MATHDLGHKLTDKELAELEKRISGVYKDAKDSLNDTISEYFAKFVERDKHQQELLKAGKITEEQYKQWRLNQIGRGKRYEALRDEISKRYTNANQVAVSYVNDATPGIYSLNRNFAAYTIEKEVGNVGFNLFDEQTVKRLIVEEPNLMPYYPHKRAVARGIDLAWGKQQITASITSGILQGYSVGKIADDLQERMEKMNRASALRTARTAITGAQNAGRQDSYIAAEKMGIKMKREWLATLDNRTRHAHAVLDGQRVGVNEPFKVDGYEIMFPGDPTAKAYLVYNCRCTLIASVDGVDTSDAQRRARDPETGESVIVEDMTYAEWAGWKHSSYNSVANDTVFPVTEKAIERVALFDPDGWDIETAKKLQNESRKLLTELIGRGLDTEAGRVYNIRMEPLTDIEIGKEGDGRISLPKFRGSHITLHTHPDGNVFSAADMQNFLMNPDMEAMAVVGNNGSSYFVQKTENYDGFEFTRKWLEVQNRLNKLAANRDLQGYVNEMEYFLEEGIKYGIQFIKK